MLFNSQWTICQLVIPYLSDEGPFPVHEPVTIFSFE